MRTVLGLVALLGVSCATQPAAVPQAPTPDIAATVDAAVVAALAEATPTSESVSANIDLAATIEAYRRLYPEPSPSSTPLPTVAPSPTPTPKRTPAPGPTPTPMAVATMTPTPTPRPTATHTATPVDLATLNWIDRELYLTGELPFVPEWLMAVLKGGEIEPNPSWAPTAVRLSKEISFRALSAQGWCRLLPSQRRALLELVVWQGHNLDDWLWEQYSIRGVKWTPSSGQR